MDNSLQNHHDLTIETLKIIVTTLRGRCSHFLDLLIPVFTYVIQQWETSENYEKSENLLRLLDKVLKQCEKGFKKEYIDPVVEVILKYILEVRLTSICLDILQTLINIKKNCLHYKLEPIIRIFKKIISGDFMEEKIEKIEKESKQIVKKSINILKYLEELLDPYLDVLIKALCKLLSEQNIEMQHQNIDLYKEVLLLFNQITIKCPSTVQYLSLLVKTLQELLERISILILSPQNVDYNDISGSFSSNLCNYQALQTMILNCFVVFVHQFRADFLVFLPLVHQTITKYKIYHNDFSQCIETLLNCGNLEDLSDNNLLDNQFQDQFDQNNKYQIIDTEFNPPLRKINSESIITEFNTQQKILKEDWEEWMRKSSVELLRQSPNSVLSPCSPLAEVYAHIWHELYNLAFASCWEVLQDNEKQIIIQQIYSAIKSPNIPQSILQALLSLAEFMQHDQEGLSIDNSTLGDLAERCTAYPQALFFREQEFEIPSEKTVESLIMLYNHLGQPEAASGLLFYAKRQLKIDLKMSGNENLQRWDDALKDYKQLENSNSSEDQFLVHKLRCLNALSDWEVILQQCDQYFKPSNQQQFDQSKYKSIKYIACNAALNLGEWDQLNQFVQNQQPNEDQVENNFYQSILCIRNSEYDQALQHVKRSRDRLEGKLGGLLLESYTKTYEHVLRLQQLFELEEIINYKKQEKKLEDMHGDYQQHIQEQNELNIQKKMLKDRWHDRLQGCQKKVHVWQGILSVRKLLLNKTEDIDNWLKFSRICIKKRQPDLAKKTILNLQKEINKDYQNGDIKFDYPIQLQLADYECDYYRGELSLNQIMSQVGDYLDQQDKQNSEIQKQISKGYLNMSKWLDDLPNDDLTDQQKEQVQKFQFKSIKESINISKDYNKAWHCYAVMNYQQIDFQRRMKSEDEIAYIVEATRGFVKTISLQGKNMFQDTLRLLNIIFNYGDYEKVSEIFQRGWKNIDILVWIEVVPQIIARIDIRNQKIYELLKNLLIHLSLNYPQALIYQLAVARRSKKEKSRMAANQLLEEMRKQNNDLVEQALLITEELIRTAILLTELWREGIQEAWIVYSQEKNPQHAFKILQGLNEKTNCQPQSLSETAFLQQYGTDIRTALAWLTQYEQTQDEVALNHAFDIYYQLYLKINEKLENLKMIHLENVSPKLLSIQDTVLALPGLYNPNKPKVIKIAGFSPQLPVQNSKQKPRRILIYGSDGKEHHYLLKGHEDLRQDERVMQLFSLINRLLNNNQESEEKDLFLQRYAVIPLSNDTGLIEWVHNCDTLQQLIRDYRESQNIKHNVETNLINQLINDPQRKKYPLLPIANKLEVFRHIMENTKGEDLQKVMWLKSPNSAVWLERRTNYTRSLAVMSMVGYILGLGDRHPSNIMLQRNTGRVVHIDFGDCWEVAMKREKFPEKVPFRLTRMLIKAMEACGIEGNFRNTCELVMKVLRDNRESLMAVLEAFLYDPLLNWRLLTVSPKQETQNVKNQQQKIGSLMRMNQISEKGMKKNEGSPQRRESGREREMLRQLEDIDNNDSMVQINAKAQAVIDRCKNKLIGRDFNEYRSLNIVDQVNKLINQATSHENICQSYIGWQPFW